MTPFFRRIRKNLIDNNQFLKYSRYAIGEIILVVLGILIALQVNDMNESKKQKKQLLSKLKKVENELIENINYLDFQIQNAMKSDSLLRTVINEQADINAYKGSPIYVNLITTYQNFDAFDNTYKSFVSNQENIPESLDSLKLLLDEVYQFNFENIKSGQDMASEVCYDFIKFLRDDKVWYKDIKLGNITDEMYDFFLHDARYLDYTYFYYRMNGPNFARSLQTTRTTSLLAYNVLYDYINHQDPTRNKERLFTFDTSSFGNYIGSYSDQQGDISIQDEGNSILLRYKGTDGAEQEYSVVPIDQNTFYLNNRYGFWHIKTNASNKKSLIFGGEKPGYLLFDSSQ